MLLIGPAILTSLLNKGFNLGSFRLLITSIGEWIDAFGDLGERIDDIDALGDLGERIDAIDALGEFSHDLL